MQKKPLTSNQKIILDRLLNTVGPDSHMTIPQFADLATCAKLQEEWATIPLKAMEKMGLVERTPMRVGKAITWRITTDGVGVAMENRVAAV